MVGQGLLLVDIAHQYFFLGKKGTHFCEVDMINDENRGETMPPMPFKYEEIVLLLFQDNPIAILRPFQPFIISHLLEFRSRAPWFSTNMKEIFPSLFGQELYPLYHRFFR